MALSNLLILAIIQGLAELLPVSSSAHVIMAEKILGLDPSAPDMTLLLVMLHSGTMFAVIVHFWKSWHSTYFSSVAAFKHYALRIFTATMMTGIVGLTLQHIIKVYFAGNTSNFEIESLFSNSKLIASGLFVSGILIIVSSRIKESHTENLSLIQSVLVGMVQGLCLPFRGLSRSGATISAALSIGVARKTAEEFSFALAVVLTPVVMHCTPLATNRRYVCASPAYLEQKGIPDSPSALRLHDCIALRENSEDVTLWRFNRGNEEYPSRRLVQKPVLCE